MIWELSVGANLICYFFLTYFQQTHQKNQLKDTIEVDEPEGILFNFPTDPIFWSNSITFLTWCKCLEVGDPLTAEEVEEKERLLEEVTGLYF